MPSSPYISRQIMELHHTKHHQTYASTPKERIALQAALRFNGGGHINHSLFWENLAPASANGGVLRDGPLKEAIVSTFGSVETFKTAFNTTTAGIQGSGWGWLGLNPASRRLEIVTTANQDPLLSHVPIIGVDIWEHAFYLQYLNVKAKYLEAIWNVINFEEAERRYLEAINGPRL
ncbi:manganese superoxide dismutase [Pisolithus croceorrhizus]|nr:manganese superoxide dismutase [Pisolithus croceorrhizus]